MAEILIENHLYLQGQRTSKGLKTSSFIRKLEIVLMDTEGSEEIRIIFFICNVLID
jgi:hypothetical protein